MTLGQLTDALWEARIALSYRDGVSVATPAAKLLALPGVAEALAEHRGAVLRRLRGLDGARLEGLVCGPCNKLTGQETALRHCPQCKLKGGEAWATPHYPRT